MTKTKFPDLTIVPETRMRYSPFFIHQHTFFVKISYCKNNYSLGFFRDDCVGCFFSIYGINCLMNCVRNV